MAIVCYLDRLHLKLLLVAFQVPVSECVSVCSVSVSVSVCVCVSVSVCVCECECV